jgi:hypothetical protein
MSVKESGITNIREMEFNHNSQRFFVREPNPDDVNNADLLRSKFFFNAIKKGVPTESEILDVLKEQGRFSEEEYLKGLGKCSAEVSTIMVEMTKAKTSKALRDIFDRCVKKRRELHEHILKRNQFVNHAAETKATNDYYMALMGACVFNNEGDPVFGEYDRISGCIDLEKSYNVIKGSSDFPFISVCAETFIPFANGLLNARAINPEYAVYADMRGKLNLPDDDIVIQYKKSASLDDVEMEISDTSKELNIDTNVVIDMPNAKEAVRKAQEASRSKSAPGAVLSEQVSEKKIPDGVRVFDDDPDIVGDDKVGAVASKNDQDIDIGDGAGGPAK